MIDSRANLGTFFTEKCCPLSGPHERQWKSLSSQSRHDGELPWDQVERGHMPPFCPRDNGRKASYTCFRVQENTSWHIVFLIHRNHRSPQLDGWEDLEQSSGEWSDLLSSR